MSRERSHQIARVEFLTEPTDVIDRPRAAPRSKDFGIGRVDQWVRTPGSRDGCVGRLKSGSVDTSDAVILRPNRGNLLFIRVSIENSWRFV